jgi:preprotein translocase subunit SecG
MTERLDSLVDHSSTTFDYDNYMLSMVKDGQSTENSSAAEDNVKTDYRLSLPSSSQMNTYRLNINSTISESRKKFLSRIITVVAIFLLVVCILLVTLTLRLAHKIDELVRLKQLMPKPNTFLLISTSTTETTTSTTTPTNNLANRRRTPSSFFTSIINEQLV